MRTLLSTFLAMAIVAAGSAVHAQSGNAVSGIEVTEGADSTEVRIRAFDHASYSVYRLRNPLRLFIDIADSEIEGTVASLDVDNGVLSQVAATEYEDELQTVTRVVLGFDQDALYDVVADGDDLVVTVDGAGRHLFLSGGPENEQDLALLESELGASVDRVAALERAVADATANVQTTEAEMLRESLAREVAERDRLAAIARANDIAADFDALRNEYEATSERVQTLEQDRAQAELALAAQTSRMDALESSRREALSRIDDLNATTEQAQTELAARDAEVAELQRELAALSGRMESANPRELAALQEERTQQVSELASRQAELDALAREAASNEAALAAALEEARSSQDAQQQLIQEQAAVIETLQVAQAAAPGSSISDIRFEHDGNVDRIVIEAPHGLEFSTLPYEDGRSAILFSGADLPDRLRRTLDTQAFEGPISFVSSYTDGDGAVRVVAELGSGASEILRQEDGQIVWEFTALEGGELAEAQGGFAEAATSYGPGINLGSTASNAGPTLPRPVMTRKRITIDLRSADIQNVLRLIADEGNVNIIANGNVTGTVTLRLRSVPLDDALIVILRSQNLGWEQQGSIIRVAPMSEFQDQYDREMERLRDSWDLEPLRVRLIPVNYAEVEEVGPLVAGVMSERGRVQVDERNNALILTDVESHLDAAESLVERIDTQTPQILIEARIVETNDGFARQLGIQWGGDFVADQSLGNATGLLFPSTIGIAGGASDGQEPTAGTSSSPNFAVNLPAPAGTGSGGAIGFTFGSLSGAFNLNLRLSAAETTGSAKVVSAPRIMTLDNEQASISSGVSIPISVVSSAGVQTVFYDATLQLDVTPRVTPDGNVFLDVHITKNEPDFQNTGARGDPSIIRREATTRLFVADGDTTVIGGIFQRNSGYSQSRVPFFGSLPVIGPLFRSSNQTDTRNELLVFITPRIVNREMSIDSLNRAGSSDSTLLAE